jgi:hypothetical protein
MTDNGAKAVVYAMQQDERFYELFQRVSNRQYSDDYFVEANKQFEKPLLSCQLPKNVMEKYKCGILFL